VNIALIGYGKMGLEIEKIAISRGHQIVQKFNSTHVVTPALLDGVDAAIEFTRPETVIQNLDICFAAGCPVITGTTGWYIHFNEVAKRCEDSDSSLFYASNFSLGVNIAFYLNELLAKIMSHHPDYKAEITEIHHTRKLDAPSGTAITLAEGLLKNNPKYSAWALAENNLAPDILPIIARREGDVPGTHVVQYSSDIDNIEIKHEAHNRRGFALGAVLAAEWLVGKKGVFSMPDMLNFDTLK
jgi:4-hydroxy-tetrahydrodipicolinate reductase